MPESQSQRDEPVPFPSDIAVKDSAYTTDPSSPVPFHSSWLICEIDAKSLWRYSVQLKAAVHCADSLRFLVDDVNRIERAVERDWKEARYSGTTSFEKLSEQAISSIQEWFWDYDFNNFGSKVVKKGEKLSHWLHDDQGPFFTGFRKGLPKRPTSTEASKGDSEEGTVSRDSK